MELIILFYMLIKILVENHQIRKAERHADWLYGKRWHNNQNERGRIDTMNMPRRLILFVDWCKILHI